MLIIVFYASGSIFGPCESFFCSSISLFVSGNVVHFASIQVAFF
jgi:hypothetical protein